MPTESEMIMLCVGKICQIVDKSEWDKFTEMQQLREQFPDEEYREFVLKNLAGDLPRFESYISEE